MRCNAKAMAPGRKKGGGALKAAAVRREWNAGELVLAKVKGYPPWPAQVGIILTHGLVRFLSFFIVVFIVAVQIRYIISSRVLSRFAQLGYGAW